MKQIKTIIGTVSNGYYDRDTENFDKEVNETIAEGWTLVERKVLMPQVQPTIGNPAHAMLYAELEKNTITEAKRCCGNCAHFRVMAYQEPCLSCNSDADKWEPQT